MDQAGAHHGGSLKVLAVIEQRDGVVRGTAAEIVSAAADLADDGTVEALLLGAPGVGDGLESLGAYGAASVIVLEDEGLAGYNPEAYGAQIADMVRSGGYEAVLFGASAQGKDLSPRVAASLGVSMASDVTGLSTGSEGVTAVRPVYSGKAFATFAFKSSPAIASIRQNAFSIRSGDGVAEVERRAVTVDQVALGYRTVGFEASAGNNLDVSEASVVVSGGRGMKGPENWGLLEGLRDALGSEAALGASRAVVDAGWRSHGEQVGQTGKTVSPKLYFALGISGAIQHLAGMRTAQTIVAVNKDPDAPIFGVANYGIVGDVFEVLPALTAEIQKLG